MAILSTGPIENRPVGRVRPTQQVTVKIDNNDSVNFSSVLIQGYYLNGTRTLYVLELFNVAPNQVITNINRNTNVAKSKIEDSGNAMVDIDVNVDSDSTAKVRSI